MTIASGAPTARGTLSRRELCTWVIVALFANSLIGALRAAAHDSFSGVLDHLVEIGVFQYLAWYAVFRLLLASGRERAATRVDIVAAIGILALCLVPWSKSIWIAGSVAAAWLLATAAGDVRLRAAGVVLGALAVQALWGPVFFNLLAFEFLRADTILVGTLLSATQTGVTWHDNVITYQGHSIIVFNFCSSFHNVSLAALCWVALTKLERPTWIPSDFLFGFAVCAAMVLLNAARLYLMALSNQSWAFWHYGAGATIFAVTASVTIFLISLWGASRRTHAA